MVANRFSDEYDTLTAYILGITERIWEGRGVGLIRRYYAGDCWMLTPSGEVRGVEAVVSGTLETLHMFPDRTLLGEDVIWADHGPGRGLLSSHRIFTTGHHRGEGMFGPPTGRPIQLRAIADCLVVGDVITEEWLVRDTGAIAVQIGQDPREIGRRLAAADAAAGKSPWHLDMWAAVRRGEREATAHLSQDPAAQFGQALIEAMVNDTDLSRIRASYDRAASLAYPRHVYGAGWDLAERTWLGLLASFPDARLVVDHAIALNEASRRPRVSVRWRLAGTHAGHGAYGPPTGARVLLLGITHFELDGGRVAAEWTVLDDVATYRMIGLQAG